MIILLFVLCLLFLGDINDDDDLFAWGVHDPEGDGEMIAELDSRDVTERGEERDSSSLVNIDETDDDS